MTTSSKPTDTRSPALARWIETRRTYVVRTLLDRLGLDGKQLVVLADSPQAALRMFLETAIEDVGLDLLITAGLSQEYSTLTVDPSVHEISGDLETVQRESDSRGANAIIFGQDLLEQHPRELAQLSKHRRQFVRVVETVRRPSVDPWLIPHMVLVGSFLAIESDLAYRQALSFLIFDDNADLRSVELANKAHRAFEGFYLALRDSTEVERAASWIQPDQIEELAKRLGFSEEA